MRSLPTTGGSPNSSSSRPRSSAKPFSVRIDSAWNCTPRKVGPATRWMSPVAGSDSRDRPGGRPSGDPGDEGVVEADALLAPGDAHRRLGALEDDVLVGKGNPEPCRTAPGARGRPRGRACRRRAGCRSPSGRPRSSGARARGGRRGRVRPRPGRRRRRRPRRRAREASRGGSTREPMPSTENTCASMFTKSSSPCRIAIVFPARLGAGGAPAWSVSQNFASRWLREFSAISTSSSWVRSAIVRRRTGRSRDQPERREDPPGLGQRLGHLVLGVGVAHQRGARRHLHRPVRADVGGADHDRRVSGRGARRRPGRSARAPRRSTPAPRTRRRGSAGTRSPPAPR